MTPEKMKKVNLREFLARYNYYINKLLITKSDPYIEKQNKCYLKRLDFDKLDSLKNVFTRLAADTDT